MAWSKPLRILDWWASFIGSFSLALFTLFMGYMIGKIIIEESTPALMSLYHLMNR